MFANMSTFASEFIDILKKFPERENYIHFYKPFNQKKIMKQIEKSSEKNAKVVSTTPNFAALSQFSKIGQKKDSIYIPEILSGTEKERKSIRRKIRNSRDAIVETFFATKNKAEKKEIAVAWREFAKSVYKNVNVIFEANTTDDKAANLAAFVSEINQILSEK